ncbi:hypothetical protein BAE44_0012683 [Dichanthelium oligosanthes]|uniref:Metallo-beta-lactamase domain-containing protein n=1 Tax=Dichanthelium oligosanthes TaxID=888268 RepID=A0A1E5VMD4_9POAL|nr:hypothetical protein BAE44_0012683 [Dichanthelium oligosanthes]
MDPDPATPPTEGAAASPAPSSSSSLILLGTGCSGALPDARCLIQPSAPPCAACSTALSLTPDQNPNYRCNTSLLIDYCHDNGTHKHILIDVGKTFREQVLRWFVHHKVPSIDSCIHCVIFAANFYSVAARFPYLVKQKLQEGDELARAAQPDWRIIDGDVENPFVASGLEFLPLPVMHGEDYVCLGFLFGRKARVAYLSDVSRILPRTEYAISKSGAGQLDLLILDTNRLNGESLDTVKRICPRKALLIGMNHEFEHHRENQMLAGWSRREGIPVQLAHDGLRIFIDL